MFRQERSAVVAATEAAHRGIDTSLVVSTAALVIAAAAIAIVIINRGNDA